MKIRYIFALTASLVIIATTSSIIYSRSNNVWVPKEKIKQGFNEIKKSLDETQDSKTMSKSAFGKDIEISKKQFILYKKNYELTNELTSNQQGVASQSKLSDTDLIDNLVKEELAVNYAKKLGITVSEEEISKEVSRNQEAIENPDTDKGNELVKELMKNRIRITGLTKEQFWKSKETRYEYEKAIFLGKLGTKLVEEKKINDLSELNAFEDSILAEYKKQNTINYDAFIK
ncbi:SurA N-terminal domain-containing protein [Paenibacillus sp. SN-8-1]|uniref:SurA N-terminal domain-containing protein n=1 Tax=Paenibacillus sp. SN-8-1 TaxID=3435409 RepID=UPI003D9A1756